MDGVCFIAIDCQMHQVQLIVGRGLTLLATLLKEAGVDWVYSSSLSKIVHVWRDSARLVYAEWKRQHGALAAETYAVDLPPKFISGRWLSMTNVEKFMIKIARNAPSVLRAVILSQDRFGSRR